MLTYKRKLKLNKAQEMRVSSWIGACRVVYNMGLYIRTESYRIAQKSVSKFDLMKQLTQIKDVDWISDVPAQSLQNAIERLDASYKNFFRTCHSGGGFPKYASKRFYKSIIFKDIRKIDNHKITQPKLGSIPIIKASEIIGIPKQETIIKEPTAYYIDYVCDGISKTIQNPDESQVCGIDMGVSYFVADSSGNFINNPKHFKRHEDRLRIESRSLSRKKKGSNRWKKQAKVVGMLHHRISNVRKDFLHKQSTAMSKKYHTVYVEDLKIKNMVKNKHLSKHILDCGWGMFRAMLKYKTNVVLVNPKYTSQTCNECGSVDSVSRVSQSKFCCTKCGHESNADINAAKNIMSKGIALNRKREAIACALVEEPHII